MCILLRPAPTNPPSRVPHVNQNNGIHGNGRRVKEFKEILVGSVLIQGSRLRPLATKKPAVAPDAIGLNPAVEKEQSTIVKRPIAPTNIVNRFPPSLAICR